MIKKIPAAIFHDFLENKIVQYNNTKVSTATSKNVSEKFCYVYEEGGQYLAGISLDCYWGIIHIDFLWVDEKLRGKRIGEQFLLIVDNLAIELSCTTIHLETFSFQAPDFYKKYGYEEFGRLENVPEEGVNLHFMKKIADNELK